MTVLNERARKQNINHRYKFVSTAEQRTCVQMHCPSSYEAYKSMTMLSSKADIFRYCLLYINGGIWVDADIVALEPLSWWVNPTSIWWWRTAARVWALASWTTASLPLYHVTQP